MRTTIFNLFILVLALSCVRARRQEVITPIEGIDENILRSECLAIQESGDIYGLLAEIRLDTRKVLSYLGKDDPRKYTSVIEMLAGKIIQNSEQVRSLAGSNWNSPAGKSSIIWRFDSLPEEAEILKVYFQGSERDDLLKHITIERSGDGAIVKYESVMTYLEYCQFNWTLVIAMKVPYPGKRTRYFNLYMDPENT